ncbi:MAG: fructosamine kinase [Alteromonadaceae bacterium]|nr:MAG: fructosamine kinase [Alteromonadaceae bacterium]
MDNFIKRNNTNFANALIMEAKGLEMLRRCCNPELIRIPELVQVDQKQLVMTMIRGKPCPSELAERLGRGLAELHKIEHAQYGFDEDNFIGLNPQINGFSDNWGDFFISRRLRYQIGLIECPSLRLEFESIIDKSEAVLGRFLNQHCAHPSLIHGDLWSGNYMSDDDDVWLIDPAVYFADREVDIAMTEMFGGFSSAFYGAYSESFPLTKAYPIKKQIFNLYHYLNHYNLFGAGYLEQCRHGLEVIEQLAT